MPIRTFFENSLDNVLIENDFILAVFLPSLGSKMIRLVNKQTGTQFLLEPQGKERRYSVPKYGEEFSDKFAYGFDDCFPTVASTLKKINMPGGGFPDHGELWSRQWNCGLDNEKIVFSISGVREKYSIDKAVSLEGNKLIIEYSLKSLSDKEFYYIWSAHPLLIVSPGDKIILPMEVKNVLLDWSSDNKTFPANQVCQWPMLEKGEKAVDFSSVKEMEFNKSVKCFTGKLQSGYAGLYRSGIDQTILFSFSPAEISYLGIWLCYGGWPLKSSHKQLTVALEPANGRPDSLVEAVKRNEASVIGNNKVKNWTLEISLWKGIPESLIVNET